MIRRTEYIHAWSWQHMASRYINSKTTENYYKRCATASRVTDSFTRILPKFCIVTFLSTIYSLGGRTQVHHRLGLRNLQIQDRITGKKSYGDRSFQAIGILEGEEAHGPQHDLESFLYVFLWICSKYIGPEGMIGDPTKRHLSTL